MWKLCHKDHHQEQQKWRQNCFFVLCFFDDNDHLRRTMSFQKAFERLTAQVSSCNKITSYGLVGVLIIILIINVPFVTLEGLWL